MSKSDHNDSTGVAYDESDTDDEINPFLSLGVGCVDDSENNIDGVLSLLMDTESKDTRQAVRRGWGIPSFEDQMDRGIRTFTLTREDHPRQSVTVYLEHRLHSTGSDLWDSALVLAHALARPGVLYPSPDTVPAFQSMSILELGSGTGAVGLFCAKCLEASHVILTDLQENLDLLWKNRGANMLSEDVVSICALDWRQEMLPQEVYLGGEGVDVIVGSDLFLPFAPELLYHLAHTLARIIKIRPPNHAIPTVALLVYEERFDCSQFMQHAASFHLHVANVENSALHPAYQDPGRIHMLRISSHR